MKELTFGNKSVTPDVRRLSDIKDVVYDKEFLELSKDSDLYYMYRDLALSKKDRDAMQKEDLRYDITIIPPGMLGVEYTKTLGHYHPIVPGTELSYTEIYEILEGEAHYLLQKEENGKITDAVLVKAGKGDKIIMPPNYGHVTINPGRKELKMSNLVSGKFSSVYQPYKDKHGGAYYELQGGFVGNENYGKLPPLRVVAAKNILELGLKKSEEIYSLVRKDLKKLGFLNRPQDYDWLTGLY
ncbi:MAG: glucose-6-phosphate isomerase family protein [Candidatus Altiarchaeia archaeon]